jgi:hypothetical protein
MGRSRRPKVNRETQPTISTSDERARWLMRHQSEEYVYLSQFLPALYKRETT